MDVYESKSATLKGQQEPSKGPENTLLNSWNRHDEKANILKPLDRRHTFVQPT